MTARLDVENLLVAAGGTVVLDIDAFSIDAGELAVVIGGAGSGKTILAAALCGSIESSGTVRVNGSPLTGPASLRARQGLAASVRDGHRVSGCSVLEALRLASRRGHRAAEAMARFPQLATRRDLPAQLLSGGEQQLLQVACAWCADPSVLVLDSPTVGLAADAAAAVTALAHDLAEHGDAVLWLEQDQRAAPAAPRLSLVRGKLAPTAAVAEGSVTRPG